MENNTSNGFEDAENETSGKKVNQEKMMQEMTPDETPKNESENTPVENTPVENTEVKAEEVETTKTVVETPEVSPAIEEVEEPEVIAAKEEVETVKKEDTAADEDDIEELEHDEAEHFAAGDIDVDNFEKKDFVLLAERMLDALEKSSVTHNDVKNIDAAYKEIRAAYDEIHGAEVDEAKTAYIAANGSDDGFAFKNDNYDIRFESLMVQIRDKRNAFYQKMEALKEDYFERKTNLLQKLRDIVEEEEKGGSKENWEAFKETQQAWKDAGNVNSPHNKSLWSAYNALLDRYFDIRSIQNELKELDRKKNLEIREGFVEKVEEVAASLTEQELTPSLLKKANEYLNEYKHTGPGTRAEQEKLWTRMKAAFDIIYAKKRTQDESGNALAEEIFAAKSTLLENLKPFAAFESDRINDWNAKTKEVLEIQEQWNKLKGPMPRDKAKNISRDFWKTLKDFFKAKSAFFNKLEEERMVNLKAKEALCVQAEEILASGDTDAANTNKIIELQKEWKTYGHVPHKFKDSIYERFKKACDAYFDSKRDANSEQNKEQEDNLAKKQELCAQIEAEVKAGEQDLKKLADYKKAFNEIGFVPRKDMKTIQQRFINAINAYVEKSTGLDKNEREKLLLKNEVDVTLKTGGNPRAMDRQEQDLKRKMKDLEDEISQLKTNIEFFGRSANAEKIKADYEKKIQKAEQEVEKLQEKVNLIQTAKES